MRSYLSFVAVTMGLLVLGHWRPAKPCFANQGCEMIIRLEFYVEEGGLNALQNVVEDKSLLFISKLYYYHAMRKLPLYVQIALFSLPCATHQTCRFLVCCTHSSHSHRTARWYGSNL